MTPEERARYLEPLLQADEAQDEKARNDHFVFLRQLGPELKNAVSVFIVALRDLNDDVRVNAAWALGEIGPAAHPSVTALANVLRDINDDVRGNAALALAKIGPAAAPAVPELAVALRDEHADVRLYASAALAELGLGAAPAVSELAAALRDEHAGVRGNAAIALGRIGPAAAPAAPLLIAIFGDKRETSGVRWNAYGALIKIEPEVVNIQIQSHDVEYFARRVEAWEAETNDSAIILIRFITRLRSELCTPLTPIMLAVTSMLEDSELPDETLKYLEIIHRNIKAHVELIDIVFGFDETSRTQKKLNLRRRIKATLKGQGAPPEWAWEAYGRLPQLKLFYLVFRVYMEGKKSLRAASKALNDYRFGELARDDLPGLSNVSLADHIRNLELFFNDILKQNSVRMLYRPNNKEGLQFTEDAQKAWEWTDKFLRGCLNRDWFGFYRLTPENEGHRSPGV